MSSSSSSSSPPLTNNNDTDNSNSNKDDPPQDAAVDAAAAASGWVEVRGTDLMLQILTSRETKPPIPSATAVDDDDDSDVDVAEAVEEEMMKPKCFQDGDAMLIDFVVRQSDGITHLDGPICQKVSGWLILIGQRDVKDALDIGLTRLSDGQTAYIWSTAKYAYGNQGKRLYPAGALPDTTPYTLPPGSSVLFHITRTMRVQDTSRLNPYFTLQKTLTRKKMGNDLYQYEWPQQKEKALKLYQKAAKDMETLLDGTYFSQVGGPDHPQYKEAKTLLLDSYNNIMALHMRAKQYKAARETGQSVLKKDAKNLKALLRLAKLSLMDPSVTLDEADVAITAAENVIVYKNKEEEQEVRKLRAQWKQRRQQQEPHPPQSSE